MWLGSFKVENTLLPRLFSPSALLRYVCPVCMLMVYIYAWNGTMGPVHWTLHEVNMRWCLKYVIRDLGSTEPKHRSGHVGNQYCMLKSGVCVVHKGGQSEEQNASGSHLYHSDGHNLGQHLTGTLFWKTLIQCYKSQIRRARVTETRKQKPKVPNFQNKVYMIIFTYGFVISNIFLLC